MTSERCFGNRCSTSDRERSEAARRGGEAGPGDDYEDDASTRSLPAFFEAGTFKNRTEVHRNFRNRQRASYRKTRMPYPTEKLSNSRTASLQEEGYLSRFDDSRNGYRILPTSI
eukprot:CAMPEP_0197179804 /NCGR_PEP_ID=MMETSP1423-20130617/4637_1 /TAXON_ID=476441 /ORGANISM="Pseudo-nitzschia heimii, Strain UNC1101" /LENGTH=113 /DNA_ID=CAMNT_0042629769 /DNA_START=40 /DNA_END=378 /DNA_ORIENTATION=+